MTHLGEDLESFVRELGIDVELVDPDGKCARWFEDEKRLRLCNQICPGRRDKVWKKVLTKVLA